MLWHGQPCVCLSIHIPLISTSRTALWVFAPPSPFYENVKCVRAAEILVEQQPPQGFVGFFVCDHTGLVINEPCVAGFWGVLVCDHAGLVINEPCVATLCAGRQGLMSEREKGPWKAPQMGPEQALAPLISRYPMPPPHTLPPL